MAMTKAQKLLERLRIVRSFTGEFLQDLTDDEWYWEPPGVTTHVAWQVGHLAIAEYGLCLNVVRGKQPSDEALIPDRLKRGYSKGSTPLSGPDPELPLDQLRQVFADIHRQTLSELAEFSDEQLEQPVEKQHRMYTTKLEAATFAVNHEFLHAGQIALLRRQMGKAPLR